MLRIPALYDKSAAASGAPIKWKGGYVHNNFGGSILQTDVGVISPVIITGSVVAGGTYVYSKADLAWARDSRRWLIKDTTWFIQDDAVSPTAIMWTNPSTDDVPPKTGWVAGTDSGSIVAEWESFWADETELIAKSYANFLAWTSGTQSLWLRWVADSGCIVREAAQYPLDQEFNEAENDRNESYFVQGDCGAGFAGLRDVSDELILDVDGNVQYTAG